MLLFLILLANGKTIRSGITCHLNIVRTVGIVVHMIVLESSLRLLVDDHRLLGMLEIIRIVGLFTMMR